MAAPRLCAEGAQTHESGLAGDGSVEALYEIALVYTAKERKLCMDRSAKAFFISIFTAAGSSNWGRKGSADFSTRADGCVERNWNCCVKFDFAPGRCLLHADDEDRSPGPRNRRYYWLETCGHGVGDSGSGGSRGGVECVRRLAGRQTARQA